MSDSTIKSMLQFCMIILFGLIALVILSTTHTIRLNNLEEKIMVLEAEVELLK
jgi:hypothetical protein